MKRFSLIALALGALAACEAPPSDNLVVTPEGLQSAMTGGADVIAPDVSPQVAINTFAQYCGRFPANR